MGGVNQLLSISPFVTKVIFWYIHVRPAPHISRSVKRTSQPGLCPCVAWPSHILRGTSGAGGGQGEGDTEHLAALEARKRLLYSRDLSSAALETWP